MQSMKLYFAVLLASVAASNAFIPSGLVRPGVSKAQLHSVSRLPIRGPALQCRRPGLFMQTAVVQEKTDYDKIGRTLRKCIFPHPSGSAPPCTFVCTVPHIRAGQDPGSWT